MHNASPAAFWTAVACHVRPDSRMLFVVVIGVDPGLTATGFGCLEAVGPWERWRLVEAGVIRLGSGSLPARLAELERDLTEVMRRVGPQSACVEALFSHYAHPRTAVSMAHARGVVLLCCQRADVPVVEVPPAEVKKAVTGHGRATKAQIQSAVMSLLGLQGAPPPADAADALALAWCAGQRLMTGAVGLVVQSSRVAGG